MNRLFYLLIIILFGSCSGHDKIHNRTLESKKIVIYGKVDNFNQYPDEILFSPNRIGAFDKDYYVQLTKNGYFSFSFKSFIPLDIWMKYRTNILILAHPGDSIYLEFDGNAKNRVDMLKSIQFNGDAVKTNRDAAEFQKMYLSNNFCTDWDRKEKANQEYDIDEYQKYLVAP